MTIRLEKVTKLFPGVARPAVDALDLTIETGQVCVLIGPSGCGKTTTMRMVNRLIEPTSGRIFVGGRDVTQADPVELRRHIGYVIQQIGLFPHMTIAQNVATVPKLLGWDPARIKARVAEMLELVGLDPGQFLARYPRHLSGGQRQRVGVARALAADPPVMLMDEPFGAVDPIVRGRLQEEFLAILKRLKKTVILVTHDIDEAIRMGDVVAILKDGRLVQYDTPDRLLAAPVNDFVADFVGADRALRRLSLVRATEAVEPGEAADGFALPGSLSVREVLSALLAEGREAATIRAENGAALGQITLTGIRARSAGTALP
ncbi:MAG: ABC transporter ATP-binding protein [Bosea sp. (in: a-proteobacteria)]|uniref:ABC transporter ATP-binding protein n=1 Tax=Bosea sp. (in: a-proteobacteria) TaxID=1871050 RepID=UPI0027346D95|nr:ABC transporter ATP-binding protein [Bosea sp. (in: a-proteobacteria)]MDP3255472.1 ABC transporter ATP-binding protein [Bosea sp. (in: a-proteobacteria)]MDP3318987.1 ABC transporter ATP-binding protein [Bosea sp. (in: a-proteobacteria)]